MDERLDDILTFADIGEFVYQPVKTYSSGMFVRLAFAVAVNVDPDILIIDEALSVGDLRFQKKCKVKMDGFKESGKTIVIVSHSMADVRAMCSTGIYLQQGSMLYWGTAFNTINLYSENESKFDADDLKKESVAIDKIPNDNSGDIAGTGDIIVKNVKCYQEGKNNNDAEIEFGKVIVIDFDYESYMTILNPVITVNIGCTSYRVISNIRSTNHNVILDELHGSGKVKVKILNQQFYPGAYAVHIAITSERVNVHLFMHNYAGGFIVKPPHDRLLCYPAALVQPEAAFTIEGN
jgi:energy-coupling factor transporter ATP-binding protein EcfA2